MKNSQKNRRLWEGLALIVVLAIPITFGALYFLNNQNTDSSTASDQVAPAAPQEQAAQPAATPLITLDDPDGLPQAVAAQQIVPFSFTVENPGDASATYPYKVYVKWNTGEEDVIDENSISLAPNASIDIAEALKFETAGASGQVYIEIQKPQESINFALPRAQ